MSLHRSHTLVYKLKGKKLKGINMKNKAKTVIGTAAAAGALFPAAVDASARRRLREVSPRDYLEVLRSQGSLYAPLGSIPQDALDILVAREDPRFFSHKGILPGAMMRAVKRGILSRRPIAGASTITQQLMKNLYLNSDRSVMRKIVEMDLALRVELTPLLTKEEILELYFNCVRYGPDVFGIADAADYYFGKTPDTLTRNQAVMLATIALSPYKRRPIETPAYFTAERKNTLYELVAVGAMGAEEAVTLASTYNPNHILDPELRSLKDIFGEAESPKTADGLVEHARSHLGAPYWSGGFGLTATLGLLNYSRWARPEEFRGRSFLNDLGKRVFDDAGLVKGYLWSSGPDARPRHDRMHDWTSAMLYEEAEKKGGMDSFDHENGRLLYTGTSPESISHVGIYSSDGCVYHAKDRAHGVTAERFDPGDWDFWSDLPGYTEDMLKGELESFTVRYPY